MKSLTSVLLAISAACFIGLGTGFVALMPVFLEFEKETTYNFFKVQYELQLFEAHSSIKCEHTNEKYADCMSAVHQMELLSKITDFLIYLTNGLLLIGVVCLVLAGIRQIWVYFDKRT